MVKNTNLNMKNTFGFEIPQYYVPECPKNEKTSFRRFRHQQSLKSPALAFKRIMPNIIPVSFNNRMLKPVNRVLHLRTIKQNILDYTLNNEEADKLYYEYLEEHVSSIEQYEIFKRKLSGFAPHLIPMSSRMFSYTRAFVTHCVKNTFVTLFRGNVRDTFYMKVLAKVSSGLIGYKGPKKSTVFARKAVIKEAGKILGNNMTSLLDIVFTSKVSRWNRKTVRDLTPNLSYVLNLYINYNRSHGNRKHVNRRRV